MRIAAFILVAGLAASVTAEAGERDIVAVFDIESSGVTLPRAVLDRLNIYLGTKVASAGYQVVPRAELQKRLRAQKSASHKDCYDQSCQIEIGRELAAQKSLSTKILRLGDECVATIAIYDLRRSATERAADASGACDVGSLVRSLEAAVQKLSGPIGTGAAPPVAGVPDRRYCPAPGTLRVGEPPPQGIYVRCVDQRGLIQGTATTWHSNGRPLLVGGYRDSKQEGPWTEYHRSGKKRREVTYRGSKREGLSLEWDEKGNKAEEGRYQADRKVGVWTRWIDGKLYLRETFVNDDRDGPHAIWDASSGLKREQGSYRQGQRVGHWIRYVEGKKVEEGPYKDDLRAGVWTEYHPSSGIKTGEGPYRADKREGRWTHFDWRTGAVADVGAYRDNQREGAWSRRRGKEEVTVTYRAGKLHGPYVMRRDGQIVYEKVYKDGQPE